MKPECTFLHVPGTSMGYARAGTKLAEALVRAGVDVYDTQDSPDEPPDRSPAEILERGVDLRGVPTGTTAKHTNLVCWVTVPSNPRGWWEGQYTAMFTMFETTKIPESFRDTIHEYDMVIVPSRQNVELFSEYNPNVVYVPLGIDPADWHYTERLPIRDEFRFLIGGSGGRKGTDIAFKAFRTVFGDKYQGPRWAGNGPAPVLVMKQPKPEEGFYAPWVQLVSGRISADEERVLYETAHCYLGPSRGEGFGLQPLQAIAQGLPTILTDAHGHADYAKLGIPISAKEVPAGYFMMGNPPGMNWWEPDFDELCEAMWDVYSHYDTHQSFAKDSAGIVARQWTFDQSAQAFIVACGDELTTPGPGQVAWHAPEAKRYLVRVNKRWACDIGELSFIFEPGRDYYETGDVKRILFESGLLDPACLERTTEEGINLDLGLNDVQLAAIPEYSGAHAHCPTCGHKLNDGPTLTDEIEADLIANAGALT